MRFLVVNTDYPAFLRDFYAARPGLENAPFAEQMRERMRTLFGVADFYSQALRALGHDALDVHVNNPAAQGAWAREHGGEPAPGPRRLGLRLRRGLVPWPTLRSASLAERILEAQVDEFRPDVILNQAMDWLPCSALPGLRRHGALVVGQHAVAPLPRRQAWTSYDLVVSSSPATVAWFRGLGVEARHHRLGFDPRVLERVPAAASVARITFVGSLHPVHRQRLVWLERVCQQLEEIEVFSAEAQSLPVGSAIRRRARGVVWGEDMYRVLAGSAITLNHHTDDSPHANNLRLYEATGCGTLLLTDAKDDLGTIFDPDREVVAYRDADECVALARRYLGDERARVRIAAAGQRRTLREHTYEARMRELLTMIGEFRVAERLRP